MKHGYSNNLINLHASDQRKLKSAGVIAGVILVCTHAVLIPQRARHLECVVVYGSGLTEDQRIRNW